MDNSLVEKDLRGAIVKYGYPQWAADWAHSVNPKYAFFVVKGIHMAFIKRVAETEKTDPAKAKEMVEEFLDGNTIGERAQRVIRMIFQNDEKPQLPKKPNDLTIDEGEQLIRDWDYMKDWWRNPSVEGVIPQRLTWAQAKQAATEWHAEIARQAAEREKEQDGGVELEDGQEIVVQFDDASYWLDLNTDYCSDEANAMGHCGSASTGTLFSLRDKMGRPKVTADIDVDGKVAGQIFGKANTTPKPEYHRKILQLLGTLKIERVKPANHGERSFAISDVDEEDLEWFEETFGYSIASGTTQAKIDEARKVIENEDKLKHTYLSFSDDGSEDYIEVSHSLYWELSDMFDFRDDFDYSTARTIDISDVKDHMGGDHVDAEWEMYGGSIILRCDSRIGYFNTSEDEGSIDGNYKRYEDIVDWAEDCVEAVEYGDGKIGDEGFATIIRTLIEHGYIIESPLTKLFDEELEAELSINRNGSSVRVNVPLGDFPLDAKKAGKGIAAKLQNKLNKVDPLLAILRKPQTAPGDRYEQPEFDFGESLIEELLRESSTQGRFVYRVNEIKTPSRYHYDDASRYTLAVAATIELTADDEEAIEAAIFFTENPQEAKSVIQSFLGFGDRNMQKAYGAAISKGNKIRTPESVSHFLGLLA